MLDATLDRVYQRHGERYVVIVIAGALPFSLLATVVAIVTLGAVYQPSVSQLLEILAVACGVSAACVAATAWSVWSWVDPVRRWIDGEHDSPTAVAAWETFTHRMPRIVVRGVLVFLLPYALFPAYLIHLLGESLSSYPGMLAGIALAITWGGAMILLWFDYGFRPVMLDVARSLRDDFTPTPPALSARRKLTISSTIFATANIAFLGAVAHRIDADPAVMLLVYVGAALAASVSIARVGNAFAVRSMFDPVGDLMVAADAVRRGDLDTRVPVLSGDEFGQLAHSFNQMVAGLAERARLHSALGSYTDPRVADRLLAEGELLDGQVVDASILFLDIRGFTTAAETQPATDTVAQLNDLFGRAVPIVAARGGHINKFTGDGLLAVFGVPERCDDHADRALDAAIDIVGAAQATDRWRIGVGVNSGRVVAGTIGGGGHLEFAVIGDAVNIAARVEELTKTTGDAILLTGHTKELLRRAPSSLNPRGAFTLRGRSEPTDVYSVAAVTPG